LSRNEVTVRICAPRCGVAALAVAPCGASRAFLVPGRPPYVEAQLPEVCRFEPADVQLEGYGAREITAREVLRI
jgi:hypothetical protein